MLPLDYLAALLAEGGREPVRDQVSLVELLDLLGFGHRYLACFLQHDLGIAPGNHAHAVGIPDHDVARRDRHAADGHRDMEGSAGRMLASMPRKRFIASVMQGVSSRASPFTASRGGRAMLLKMRKPGFWE